MAAVTPLPQAGADGKTTPEPQNRPNEPAAAAVISTVVTAGRRRSSVVEQEEDLATRLASHIAVKKKQAAAIVRQKSVNKLSLHGNQRLRRGTSSRRSMGTMELNFGDGDGPPASAGSSPTRFADICNDACGDLLDNEAFSNLMLVSTLVVLVLDDVRKAALPPGSDIITDVVLLLLFTLFVLEFVLSCVSRKYYTFSLFFWLDLIATLSILPDVLWVQNALGLTEDPTQVQYGEDIQSQANAARAGRAARVGARATRVLRVLRVLRILRFVRIFALVKHARARIEDFFHLRETKAIEGKPIVVPREQAHAG